MIFNGKVEDEFAFLEEFLACGSSRSKRPTRKKMSVKDKGHPPNKRLAAVSFLNSISLNGSYKDSCWSHESDKQESGGGDVPDFRRSGEGFIDKKLLRERDENKIYTADERLTSTNINNFNDHHSLRLRSNTGNFHRGIQYADGYPNHTKHAHFSSSESLDHGKHQHLGANISDVSVNRQNTTIFNLRTDPLPPIKNERLVIVVSHRSPLVVFSALPYTRDNKANRATDRPELIRRTRNVSGGRPISSLSDPDPLEQLVHYREEEISYGCLLKPAKAFLQMEQGTAGGIDEPDNVNARRNNLPRGFSQDTATASESLSPMEDNSPEHRTFHGHGGLGLGVTKTTLATYSPHMLDDPEFRAGKHRTLLTFPSYITSVIDYCKASDMKKELNDKFKDRFPHIHLTLSKLRSLKREMRKVAKAECNIDLLTVAQAYVYFEKLILGSFVTKYNRKFCAGACLLLSAKLNDVKGSHLHNLLEMIERTFRVNRKELLSFEFAVLVALEFTLHLPTWEVFPHYQRLLYES